MNEIEGTAEFRVRRKLLTVDVDSFSACSSKDYDICYPYVQWVFEVVDGRQVLKSNRCNYPIAVVEVNEMQYVDAWGAADRGAWAIAGGLLQFYPGLFQVCINRSTIHDGFQIYRTEYDELRACGLWISDVAIAVAEFGLQDLPPDLQVAERIPEAWREYLNTELHYVG